MARRQFTDAFPEVLEGSESWDVGSIADGDEAAQEITVTGAALGDFCLVSSSLDAVDLQITADVTAADVVTVVISNSTGAGVDIGTPTIRVVVLKRRQS